MLRPLLVLLALLPVLASADGGEYKVEYSGGHTITSGPGYSFDDPNPQGELPDGSVGKGFDAYVLCDGEITATLTWVPGPQNDPVPDVVIVEERSRANAMAASFAEATSGLPDEESSSAGPPSYFEYAAGASGVRYSVKSGSSFTVSCSPIAEADFGPFGYDAEAQVVYVVKAYIPKITLSGGLMPQAKEILVGQRLTAALALPSGWTASSYAWSVSGADPFKLFDVNGFDDSGFGHRIDLAAGDKDDATLTCCFADMGNATVTVSAHVLAPDGTPFDLSPQATASVIPPVVTDLSIRKGKVVGQDNSIRVADPDGNTFKSLGIQWDARVTLPSGFGSGGQWGWVQLLSVSTTRVVNGVTKALKSGTSATGYFTEGSDGTLPTSSRPDIPLDPQGYFVTDGMLGGNFDTPSEFLDSVASSYHVENNFQDWLMFRPPGAGSQFVPLRKFTWYYKGDASHAAPNGPWTYSGLAHDFTAPEATSVFPDWSRQHSNSGTWVNP